MKLTAHQESRLQFALKSESGPVFVVIDSTCKIHPTTLLGLSGFGYARNEPGELVEIGHSGHVIIKRDTVIRAYCTIDRGTVDNTVIGEGNKLDHHIHVAHNVKIGNHNTLANGCIIEGSCEIGDFNTFGTAVIMQRKTKVGNNCTIGSGSVITKDIPDNSIVYGNPARVIRTLE